MTPVAEIIRTARIERGYTQERLAREADVSVGTVRALEQGRRLPKRPTHAGAFRVIAETLGLDVRNMPAAH